MSEFRADDAAADSLVTGKHLTEWGNWSDGGLLVGNKGRRAVVCIYRRCINVPTDAKIGGKSRRDAVVVLRKGSNVPSTQVRDIRRVLFK